MKSSDHLKYYTTGVSQIYNSMIKDKTLIASLLPASLINKGFIEGESKCNYEIYLLELLNKSHWFCTKYPGGFETPKDESHGENDANNPLYQIDFKLFAAETALRARNLLSASITVHDNGEIIYGRSKKDNCSLKATKIFAAFRSKSLDELVTIKNASAETDEISNDIKAALNVLEVKKNLLLFFPYEFSFTDKKEIDSGIAIINGALYSDFKIAFMYRAIVADKYDTYFTCVYDDHFLIFQVFDDRMLVRDTVSINELPTYKQLADYNELW